MDIYDEMIVASGRIAAEFPDPRFYEACATELAGSRRIYGETPLVARALRAIKPGLARNEGHGLEHAIKVSVEAGALVLAEGARTSLGEEKTREAVVLAQIAGLLHDMRRTDRDHAASGAEAAGALLEALGMARKDRRCVSRAIAGHEAFAEPPAIASATEKLVSDALYDADKFRWGPDNFVTTLWEICDYEEWSLPEITDRFPEGLSRVESVAGTFRTRTGRKYGPEMISQGMMLGRALHEQLRALTGPRRSPQGRPAGENP